MMPISHPSAAELCNAVGEFLKEEVVPIAVDDGVNYKLRVAMNALKIIERELQLGSSLRATEQKLLSDYLGYDGDVDSLNAALIAQINGDELTGRDDELLAVLAEITMAKMAIDNPRYSTYKKRQG